MRECDFADVNLESREVVLSGDEADDLASCLLENLKAFVGDIWSEGEKRRMESAMETVLREQSDKFCVHHDGKVGVRCVAWIGTGRK